MFAETFWWYVCATGNAWLIMRTMEYLIEISGKRQKRILMLIDEFKGQLKRGKVVWVDFGFNIDEEFGGRHPAVTLKLFGNSMYCIPIDSGHIPDDKRDKNYAIDIPGIRRMFFKRYNKIRQKC